MRYHPTCAASKNSSLWYFDALWLGFGSAATDIFAYLGGSNSRNQSIIGNARTVPFIVRPLSSYASPPGFWLLSMLVSPANYPDDSTIPPPNRDSNLVLETLGLHTFATLAFNATKPVGDPDYDAPYFTYFLRCDAQLASGLPTGWQIKNDSVWTPAWLFYNGATAESWTSACLAEVEPSPADGAIETRNPSPAEQPVVSGRAPTSPSPIQPPRSNSILANPAASTLRSGAPGICGVLLEFETYAWGAWDPPHAPNVVLPQVDGGTYGMTAGNAAHGVVYMGVPGFVYGVAIGAINISSGELSLLSTANNLPLPPPGFSGVNGHVFAIAFDESVGLMAAMTEICKYGPLPPQPAAPGLPVGWTTISTVDAITGVTTALTIDLTPALSALPPVVSGLGAFDPAGRVFWLLASPPYPQLPGRSTSGSSVPWHGPSRSVNNSSNGSGYLVGVQISTALGHTTASPILYVLPTVGKGLWLTAFEYASAAGAIVALEFPQPLDDVGAGVVNLYTLDGSVKTLGTLPPGQVTPGFGLSEVSADGRYVYFQVLQGPATFGSAGLAIVDVVAETVSLTLASPDDEFEVLGLFRCD